MPLTLALLREDLRTHLGMDVSDLDDTDADRLLNRAWWSVSSQLRFREREGAVTLTLTAGTRAYSIPTTNSVPLDVIQRVVIRPTDGSTSDWDSLIKIDDWNMFEIQDDSADMRAQPTKYSTREQQLIFDPVPDKQYLVNIKYLKTLQDIQSSGPEAPQEWHEVILWGAISRGFFARGDWNRGTAAQNQQAVFMQILDTQEDKNEEDHIYSGLRVIRRRYP